MDHHAAAGVGSLRASLLLFHCCPGLLTFFVIGYCLHNHSQAVTGLLISVVVKRFDNIVKILYVHACGALQCMWCVDLT